MTVPITSNTLNRTFKMGWIVWEGTTQPPLCGSTSCAASLHRASQWMTGLEQSLRDPQPLLIGVKPWGNLPGSDGGSVCRGGAEVSSTRWWSPWVNQRWSVWVGAWNVLSLREDDRLSLL